MMGVRDFVNEVLGEAERVLGIPPADPTANWRPWPGVGKGCCAEHEKTFSMRWNEERMGWDGVYIECEGWSGGVGGNGRLD